MRTSTRYQERDHSVRRFDIEVDHTPLDEIDAAANAIVDWCIIALLLIGAAGILFWSMTA